MQEQEFFTKILFEGGNNCERIGASSTIIEHTNEKGDIVRVMYDLGALFPPENSSADCFVPDIIKYLGLNDDENLQAIIPSKKQRSLLKNYHHNAGGKPFPQLDALFITHMHEDHIGGIVNLCRTGFNFPPIYGSIETISVLNRILSEKGIEKRPVLYPIQESIAITKDFIVTPFAVSHSVIGALGYHTLTKVNGENYAGLINMGDFNLSQVPLGKGYETDEFHLFLKDKFVTHILADSTSTLSGNKSFKTTAVTFEEAEQNYAQIMQENKNSRIVSAVISRSFQNMSSLIRAAQEQNRHVYIDGYMQRIVYDELQNLGLLEEFKDTVYGHDHIIQSDMRSFLSKYAPGQQVIIFSGAFAEGQTYGKERSEEAKMSGLVRLANIKHKHFFLDKETVIVLGQRAIPVGTVPYRMKLMCEKLSRLNGNRLIQNEVSENASLGNYPMVRLQRSGHANPTEMIDFITSIQTSRLNNQSTLHVIPIHGDTKQLAATTKIARRAGAVPIICYNGDIIVVGENETHKKTESPIGTRKWLAFEETPLDKNPNHTLCNVDIYEETPHVSNNQTAYHKITRLAQIIPGSNKITSSKKKKCFFKPNNTRRERDF